MNRRLLTIILLGVTVAVGAAAVYIGTTLGTQSNTAPEETSAAVPGVWYVGGCLEDVNGCGGPIQTSDRNRWSYCVAGPNPCNPNTGWDTFCDCNPISNPSLGCVVGNFQPDVQTPLEVRQTWTNPGTASNCDVGCGGQCTTSADCATGFTCDGGTCKNSGCVANPDICDATGCQPAQNQCGGSCWHDEGAWSNCPDGHTCEDPDSNGIGTCQNAGCVANPDICDASNCNPSTNACGERCWGDASAWANCGSGHTCADVGSDGFGTCQLSACVNGTAECNSNNCATITNTPTPTPSPTTPPNTGTPTPTPTPSPTTPFTITECSEECDPSGAADQCGEGHICADHDNDGTSSCVLTECSQGSLICAPDGCIEYTPTPTPSITTVITDVLECYETGCDDVGNSCVTGLTCVDNRCVNASYPDSADCKPGTITTLPPTALISDEADRMLIAFALIITGVAVYVSGAGRSFGQVLWNVAGFPNKSTEEFEQETLESLNERE